MRTAEPKTPARKPIHSLTLPCGDEYADWVKDIADHDCGTVSSVLADAVKLYAQTHGFQEPPLRSPPRPRRRLGRGQPAA